MVRRVPVRPPPPPPPHPFLYGPVYEHFKSKFLVDVHACVNDSFLKSSPFTVQCINLKQICFLNQGYF